MWHKLNLLTALTLIIHPHWDQDLVGSLLKSCQGLLKLKSKLLSKLPASCSWAAFFILALDSIFSVRNICLSLDVLSSLNTSFIFTKLHSSRLVWFKNPLFADLPCYGCYLLSQWLDWQTSGLISGWGVQSLSSQNGSHVWTVNPKICRGDFIPQEVVKSHWGKQVGPAGV